MNKEELDLYILQFQELNHLLKNEWLDIKKLLEENKINLSTTSFISFDEDEDGKQYGILLTKEKEIVTFEIDKDNHILIQFITDQQELEQLQYNDPSVTAALIHFQ
ncbi:hypothetical protein [Commensalibacter communis]|uniref:Uncharacterized protein n=1 Tax=Commensalibacter communis TaxID=2972786 RepID=A0A9W4TNZ8_9PROT|nr:hypothetical protein [Commensalibacter communis]CAI3935881.1 unnamed protein product [Commensalibacter communis]CAI3937816.1 unnamed protein product [Commensalibacter communis]CAI3942335.1 unnamed protein product [Commensalibacter communis]CAI3942502.1 unnamed protein product [Commensalibacter communis]CAI3944156.1 unnamed protein product [Commensalibacter communis]